MRIVLSAIAILFCLSVTFDSVEAAKPRPKRSSSKSDSRKKAKGKKSKVEPADVLYKQADSLFVFGDSTLAAEKLANLCTEYPNDTLAGKALVSAASFWVDHGKSAEAMNLLQNKAAKDSLLAPQMELLTAKAYAGIERKGYALMLAREMETKYAGTDWEKQAKDFAKSLSPGIKPLDIGSNAPPQDTLKAQQRTSSKGNSKK